MPCNSSILTSNKVKECTYKRRDECLKKIFTRKVRLLTTHLKCLYTDAHSMGDKQELIDTVHLDSYSLITITEILLVSYLVV